MSDRMIVFRPLELLMASVAVLSRCKNVFVSLLFIMLTCYWIIIIAEGTVSSKLIGINVQAS